MTMQSEEQNALRSVSKEKKIKKIITYFHGFPGIGGHICEFVLNFVPELLIN